MKIVMIAPTPFFADRGCHTRIYGEITALQRLGHEVILVTYGLGREINGINTIRCFNFPWYKKLSAGPSIWKIMLLPFIALKAIRVIRIYKPEIVHAHLHEGAFVARFCYLFYKKPLYIFDCQGSLSGEIVQHKFVKKEGIFYKVFIKLERRIDSWFPIITQSENLYQQLQNMGVQKEKIINVLDSVDVNMFMPREADKILADKYHINLNKPRVLFMGMLEEYQGVDLMFEAFRHICQKRPDVQFIVIGFPNIDKYQRLARKLNIEKNIIFTGKVKFEEVPEYLSLSCIAIAPKISNSEGDGKIYNYMAMEMAIVCFDRRISKEILGDAGLFAKMKDTKDMANKVLSLIEDENLASGLGEKARKRAVAKLSADISAKKIEKFYKDLLYKKNGK